MTRGIYDQNLGEGEMNVCYLTGRKLKPKKKNIEEDDAESLEHIIQNALGGKLTSTHILSHKANQDLNELVDKQLSLLQNFRR